MDRIIDRISARLALAVLLSHAVLVPALYFGISTILERTSTEAFLNQVRMNARLMADELEVGDTLASDERIELMLDSVLLSGGGAYADLLLDGKQHRSRLLAPGTEFQDEDFSLGEHGDSVYHLTVPINRATTPAVLRLGFDEAPTVLALSRTKTNILEVLGAYTLLILILATWFGSRLTGPLEDLRRVAGSIRSGRFDLRLDTNSTIFEIRELASHLESMRTELVGSNERLQIEMTERAAGEQSRIQLEARLGRKKQLETIGTLAGGIAHEFNNILVPILLYSEVALSSLEPSCEAYEDLRQVVAAARRARELIGKILTFSRAPESSVKQRFNLRQQVEEVAQLLFLLVPPAIEIRTSFATPLPEILGDRGMVHQMVTNLCMNAYQAMRATGGTLDISLDVTRCTGDSRVPDGEYVVLSVRDTGHGIAPETLERIFEPFFTTRQIGDGSGLGLSVVHGVVASLGATITVASEPGCGSVFSVYIPPA
jgi:signal transduction histidine kinase